MSDQQLSRVRSPNVSIQPFEASESHVHNGLVAELENAVTAVAEHRLSPDEADLLCRRAESAMRDAPPALADALLARSRVLHQTARQVEGDIRSDQQASVENHQAGRQNELSRLFPRDFLRKLATHLQDGHRIDSFSAGGLVQTPRFLTILQRFSASEIRDFAHRIVPGQGDALFERISGAVRRFVHSEVAQATLRMLDRHASDLLQAALSPERLVGAARALQASPEGTLRGLDSIGVDTRDLRRGLSHEPWALEARLCFALEEASRIVSAGANELRTTLSGPDHRGEAYRFGAGAFREVERHLGLRQGTLDRGALHHFAQQDIGETAEEHGRALAAAGIASAIIGAVTGPAGGVVSNFVLGRLRDAGDARDAHLAAVARSAGAISDATTESVAQAAEHAAHHELVDYGIAGTEESIHRGAHIAHHSRHFPRLGPAAPHVAEAVGHAATLLEAGLAVAGARDEADDRAEVARQELAQTPSMSDLQRLIQLQQRN